MKPLFDDVDLGTGSHTLSASSTSRQRSSANFREKPGAIQKLINEALDILSAFGVPMDDSGRRREAMAMAFIAVAGVRHSWRTAQDFDQGRSMKSRDIIEFRNEHLGEKGSPGSYDDIRRRDLKLLVTAGIVVNSVPGSRHNAPNRGYALHPQFAKTIRAFGTPSWTNELKAVMQDYQTLLERLSTERQIGRVAIHLAEGVELSFGPGAHNALQKAVIEEFLPRYGYGAEILYVGDAEDKHAHYSEKRLRELGFFALEHEELPDVVAYSESKNWLYVIEAVATSGPVDALRHARLRALLTEVKASGVIYVTAFPDRGKVFRQYMPEISWQTEVWVASDPDHLIHLDGERFLGPYEDAG